MIEILEWDKASPQHRDAILHNWLIDPERERVTVASFFDFGPEEVGKFVFPLIQPYTGSMWAAWLILQQVAKKTTSRKKACSFFLSLAKYSGLNEENVSSDGKLTIDVHTLASLTPEMICKAALEFVGIEVREET